MRDPFGNLKNAVAARFLQRGVGETQAHHRRQGVQRDGGARGVGVEAQNGVAGPGGLQGPLNDGANDQERLAGPGAPGEAGVALRPVHEAACGILPRAERDHAGVLV